MGRPPLRHLSQRCAFAVLAWAGFGLGQPVTATASPPAAHLALAAEYNAKGDGMSMLVMHEGQVVFEDYPTRHHPEAEPDKAWNIATGTKSFSGSIAALLVAERLVTSLTTSWLHPAPFLEKHIRSISEPYEAFTILKEHAHPTPSDTGRDQVSCKHLASFGFTQQRWR